ncbi:MAG: hypothetical protein H7Y13_12075 [Sphingobacteriaceae bacterium]|nr:hypothetical protein [Sphingobacteriaceae bacterium]
MNSIILSSFMAAFLATTSCQQKIRPSASSSDTTNIQTESKNGSTMENTTPSMSEVEEKNKFSLQIEPKVFNLGTIGKAKLTLTNNSKEAIMTGENYFVESYSAGSWKRIKAFDELVFIAIGYNIAPGKNREFEINLKVVPYNFIPGSYRVGKHVILSDKNQQNITAEFKVVN